MSEENIIVQLARQATAEVERALVGRVEEIEGRVPSDSEVSRHCLRIVRSGNPVAVYTWKGMPIIEVHPPEFGAPCGALFYKIVIVG